MEEVKEQAQKTVACSLGVHSQCDGRVHDDDREITCACRCHEDEE